MNWCLPGYFSILYSLYLFEFNFQLLLLALTMCLTSAAPQAPGWSIWSGGMWNIPDDDGDNIPGVGGNDYPVNGQKELCGLNPTNPGC